MCNTINLAKVKVNKASLPPISITRYCVPSRASLSLMKVAPFPPKNSFSFKLLQYSEAASGSRAMMTCLGVLFVDN